MSTKIWVAYKMKDPTKLWPLVHDIRIKATANVKAALNKLYDSLMPDVKDNTGLYQSKLKLYEGDDWSARHSIVHEALKRLYRWNSISLQRSIWDFDVSVGFREWNGQIYIIPYCDMIMKDTLDFLKEDKRLRDYHYQNQTDRPEGLSRQAWNARARVWDGMADSKSGKWQDVLVLNICQQDFYYMIDPWFDRARAHFLQKEAPQPRRNSHVPTGKTPDSEGRATRTIRRRRA